MGWGKKSEAGAIMLTHLLVTSAVADLRSALQSRRPARWACRVVRLLAPGWLAMLCELHGPFLDLLRGWCDGGGPAEGGFVYCLFTRTT
eukprot:15845680-Heterocapsa_arctica.AAC.1